MSRTHDFAAPTLSRSTLCTPTSPTTPIATTRRFSTARNCFVAEDYPLAERFARLTKQEVKAGLFEDPSRIGTARGWQEALQSKGVTLKGHRLVRS